MFPVSFARFYRSRRPVGCVLLAIWLAGAVGIPTFPTRVSKSGRFPCEHCPCGCSSADYCWDQCCCFTDVEKLEWATANAVTAPAFLVERAAGASESAASATSGSCCCCSSTSSSASPPEPATEKPSCDLPTPGELAAANPEAPRGSGGPERQDSNEPGDQVQRLVLLRFENVAKCRGLKLAWSLLSELVIDPPTSLRGDGDRPLIGRLVVFNERCGTAFVCPDPPIP